MDFIWYRLFLFVLIIMLLKLSTGCFPATYEPECWMQNEAEKVALSYEELFDVELSNENFECIHTFEVGYGTTQEITEFCNVGPNNTIYTGCFRPTVMRPKVEPFIYLSTEVTEPAEQIMLFRHESTHLLLWCTTGNLDRNHHSPAFEEATEYADFIEETAWICKQEIE